MKRDERKGEGRRREGRKRGEEDRRKRGREKEHRGRGKEERERKRGGRGRDEGREEKHRRIGRKREGGREREEERGRKREGRQHALISLTKLHAMTCVSRQSQVTKGATLLQSWVQLSQYSQLPCTQAAVLYHPLLKASELKQNSCNFTLRTFIVN